LEEVFFANQLQQSSNATASRPRSGARPADSGDVEPKFGAGFICERNV